MTTDHCTRHAFTDGSCCKTPGGCNNCPGEGLLTSREYARTLQKQNRRMMHLEALFWVSLASAGFVLMALRAFGVWSPAS